LLKNPPLMRRRHIDQSGRATMHFIHWSRSMLPAAFAFIISLYLAPQVCAQGSPSDHGVLHFLFAVGAQPANPDESEPVPIETHAVLSSGDRIKFFLEPKSDAYFYLFHLGPQDDLSLLFPPDLKKAQASPDQPFYVPEGPFWYELDAARGTERFFFLASKSRLRELETLYVRHAALTEGMDTQSSTQAILNEVNRLIRQRKSMAAPAERPIRIAGKQRGPQTPGAAVLPDIAPFAKEIVAQGFYSRTITIDHR
jgi:hypothetical protein